jgi:hypothetical protein
MNAKIWSERLITLIILESVGFFLIKLAVGMNDYLVGEMTSQMTADMFNIDTGGVSLLILIVVIIWGGISVAATLLALIVRQLLLGILVVCFPFTLLLYMTPPARRWGSVAMNMTLAVVFMCAVDALILYGGTSAAGMVGLVGDAVLRPIVFYLILGLVGVMNVYILLMVPGLSGAVGSTMTVHRVTSGGVESMKQNFGN